MNPRNNPSRRAILLVDDDGDHRWLMTDALRSAGWDGPIESAATAGQALATLLAPQAARFALVLLDVHMPGMDGLALLDRLRRDFEAEQLPVVIVSGSGPLDANRRAAFARGANDYIPKCDLLAMIEQLGPVLDRFAPARRAQGAAHE